MAETTNIAWTDSTFNPWIGCTKVGPGCDHCYAEALAKRTGRDVWGPGKPRMETKGPWREVAKWQRQHGTFFAEHGRKRRVFCASLADVFDNEITDELRARMFQTMEDCKDLEFQVVTKRIGNLRNMVPVTWGETWPGNVGIIATIVNQAEANRDIPKLLAAKAAFGIAWVGLSMEPLLEAVNLTHLNMGYRRCQIEPDTLNALTGRRRCGHGEFEGVFEEFNGPKVDWVIVGGESGPGHRPFNHAWARSICDQCAATGTPIFIKQVGAFRPDDAMIPEDLRIREFPARKTIGSVK